MAKTTLAQFYERVRRDQSGCHIWVGSRDRGGYGRIGNGLAHRWIYEATIGPIPDGLTIDHLCRRPACVNPSHLEPVTQRENTLRGNAPAAINARRTHCTQGHEFTADNTYITPSTGSRQCRECARSRQKGGPIGRRPVLSVERFRAKVKDDESGCHLWLAATDADGYPVFTADGERRGHRWSYAHFNGPIPPDYGVTQTCGIRECVNPAHLEASPLSDILSRPRGTHCKWGHEFTAENTMNSGGQRYCRICHRERQRKRRKAAK